MISTIVSRLVILVFGTLYPAYASYKAVRTKNVKEYVKWMMYWIVFALFTCAETITDVFLSWFPFYYEIKIVLVLWLLSPATKGSSILYRKFVHPMLSQREQEIDEYLAKAKEQGYHTVLNLGSKGVTYATNVIMQTAIKGGGGIVNQLKKSYSLSDLSDDSSPRIQQSMDVVDQEPRRRSRRSPHRSHSERNSKVDMYFPEMDIRPDVDLSIVRSTDDISSGYSSAEPLYGQTITQSVAKVESREGLVRTASVGGASRSRTRTTRATAAKKVSIPEDSEREDSSGSDSETTIPQKLNSLSTKNVITKPKDFPEESDSGADDFVDTIDSTEKLSIPIIKTIDVITLDVSNEKITKDSFKNLETNEEKQLVAAKETNAIPTADSNTKAPNLIDQQCTNLLENVKHLSEHVISENIPKICQNINHAKDEPNLNEHNLKEQLTNVIKTLEKSDCSLPIETTKDEHFETPKSLFQSKNKTKDEVDFWKNVEQNAVKPSKLEDKNEIKENKTDFSIPSNAMLDSLTTKISPTEAPQFQGDFLEEKREIPAVEQTLFRTQKERNLEETKLGLSLIDTIGIKDKLPSVLEVNDPSGVLEEEAHKQLEEKKVLDEEIKWVKEEIRSIDVDFAKENVGATLIEEKVVEDEFFEANLEENDNEEDEFLEMENQNQENLGIKNSKMNLGINLQNPEPFQSKSVEDLPSENLDTSLVIRERPKSSLDYKVFDSLLHGEGSQDVANDNLKDEKTKEKGSGFFSSRGGFFFKLRYSSKNK